MRIKIDLKTTLFYSIIMLFGIESIIRYIGVEWVLNSWGTIAAMIGNTMWYLDALELLLLFTLAILVGFKRNLISLCSAILIAFGFFWCVYNYESGLSLISANSPPTLLIGLGCFFLISQEHLIWYHAKKICPIIAILFLLMCVYEAVEFATLYPLARMANGKIIEHFSIALWSVAVWQYMNGENTDEKSSKKNMILIYVCCVTIIAVSIIITSRGWMLQAFILFLFCYVTASTKATLEKIKRVFWVIIILIAIIYVLFITMENSVFYLISRFSEDTRSNQLETFFNQVSIQDLIIGQGFDASYIWNGSSYKYIDNQFLFFMFRYGVVPLIAYLLPFFCVLLKKARKMFSVNDTWKYRIFVVMLLMAMGGLSIYYNIGLDLGHMFVVLAIGNVIMESERNIMLEEKGKFIKWKRMKIKL